MTSAAPHRNRAERAALVKGEASSSQTGQKRRVLPTQFSLHQFNLFAGICCLAIITLVLSACRKGHGMQELRSALTSGHWSKIIGTGMLQERYFYTFSTNGSYSARAHNSFGVRPMKGKWRILDRNGELHLLLENEEAYYYWLWQDSVIRYDRQRDVLVVRCPFYTGDEELLHVTQPKPQSCRQAPAPSKMTKLKVTCPREIRVKVHKP